MKERMINQVLYGMQEILGDGQLSELKTVLQNVMCGYRVEPENQEVMVLDDSWRDDLEAYLMAKALEGKSAATLNRYRYELNRLLSYVNKAVEKIRPGDISGYMRAYKRARGISNQTLKNIRAVFSSFFGWLRDRDRVRKNPMVQVEQIKVEKKIRKPYSDTEREKMLRNCRSLRDKALLEFLYSTAVRVSELSALNISDVRFGTRDMIVFGKGAKERVVYLNERSNMYLLEYLAIREDNNPALFVSERYPHERLTKSGIEDIVRKTGRKAGVHAFPHRFRRTAATNALNRGMPVQEVAKLLGHSKLETTMEYCTVEQESVKFHHGKYLSA